MSNRRVAHALGIACGVAALAALVAGDVALLRTIPTVSAHSLTQAISPVLSALAFLALGIGGALLLGRSRTSWLPAASLFTTLWWTTSALAYALGSDIGFALVIATYGIACYGLWSVLLRDRRTTVRVQLRGGDEGDGRSLSLVAEPESATN